MAKSSSPQRYKSDMDGCMPNGHDSSYGGGVGESKRHSSIPFGIEYNHEGTHGLVEEERQVKETKDKENCKHSVKLVDVLNYSLGMIVFVVNAEKREC